MWKTEDCRSERMIAGAVVVDEMLSFLDTIEDGTALRSLVRNAVQNAADLDRNEEGRCERLPIALSFEGSSAFLYEDESVEAE